ncbi:MAG: hypothetical protein KAJ18_09305 [Candidatus Omnitrophica bacterium]|nr:hypothetical protein [Candidatus Omnitrophota bacterium]
MIELMPKLTAIIKIAVLPLFLTTTIDSARVLKSKKWEMLHDEEAPGDNFPYIMMTSNRCMPER